MHLIEHWSSIKTQPKIWVRLPAGPDGTICFGSGVTHFYIYSNGYKGLYEFRFYSLQTLKNQVYVGVGSELIDTNTGAERWNLNTGNFIGSYF